MRRKGFSEDVIRAITVDNPAWPTPSHCWRWRKASPYGPASR